MPTAQRRMRRLASVQPPSPPERQPPSDGAGEDSATTNLRGRFRPLAKARTSAALAALDYLGQLAVRARYHYTDAEAQDILDALGAKLEELVEAFSRGTGNKPTFQFGDEGGER